MNTYRIPCSKEVLLLCASDEEYGAVASYLFLHNDSRVTNYEVRADRMQFNVVVTTQTKPSKIEYWMTLHVVKTGVSFFGAVSPFVQGGIPHHSLTISVGALAGLRGQPIGEVIQSNSFLCADIDMTTLGAEDGAHWKPGTHTLSSPLILSGSFFLANNDQKRALLQRFPDAVAYDMENYMYNTIEEYNEIPFFSCKAVSDGGEDKAYAGYDEAVVSVTKKSLEHAITFALDYAIQNWYKGDLR